MLGVIGTRSRRVGGGTAPPSELIRDSAFNRPDFWDVGDPAGTSIGFGQAISVDDSGSLPCSAALLAPLVPGSQYRIRVQVLSALSGAFQIFVRLDVGGSPQLLVSTSDAGQLIDQVFTASDAHSIIEIRWYEYSITLDSISITPAPMDEP